MGLVAYRSDGTALALARCGSRCTLAAFILSAVVAAALHPAHAQKPVQVNQIFNSQGPAPQTGNYNWIGSADATPNGTDTGAVQSVLLDPALGVGTMFAAGTNGGVWISTNKGTSWKPLTDNQASLSIGSLSLDPTDASGKTIIAGIGLTDNGFYSQTGDPAASGGVRTGLLYTTNGGTSWSALSLNVPNPESVVSAMARGQTILAATYEVQAPRASTTGYGLFRSTDGGATFTNLAGAAGSVLPAGAVTSLVADPSNPTIFYAAIKVSGTPTATAVYMSTNTGATWAPVFPTVTANLNSFGSDQTVITLAAGPNGSVVVAVSDLAHPHAAPAVFLSGNQGANWSPLTGVPAVNSGDGQTPQNLHIAIDPTNKNIVYISGDTHDSNSVQLYRLNYNPLTNTTATPTSLTFEGTQANNTQDANTAHPDSRSITFDQAGNLIISTDGGIYVRSNPQGAGVWEGGSGTWSNLNGSNLALLEGYAVAYDSNSKRIGIASQDNGVALQTAPGGATYTTINGGDGTNIAINDKTLAPSGLSAIYSSAANLAGLSRLVINAQGVPQSPGYDPVNAPGGVAVVCTYGAFNRTSCDTVVGVAQTPTSNGVFFSQFVLNKVDPTRIAITGLTDVFVAQDALSNVRTASTVNLDLTDIGTTSGTPIAVAYGTQNNHRAIAVGSDDRTIWISQSSGTNSLSQTNYAGGAPTGMVFDNRVASGLFAADGKQLWYSTNATGVGDFTSLALPAGFIRPTAVEFISNNGANALLVGGLNTPLSCTLGTPNGCVISSTQSPIIVADNNAFTNFRAFGQGLPNALIFQMAYNSTADVLAVSSIGRGAYLLYDVTSYFPQATVLQFGLADNDSMPDASYLTNGTVGIRQLIKYGVGTLTIAGDATYTGGTVINGGMLVLGNGGTSGSVIGNITFCGSADPSCNPFLVFNRSDTYTFTGSITGPGQLIQAGPGTTVLSGQSTYTGPTTVDAGTLSITGSITSSVFVNSGGVLSGSGAVGATTINDGGLLAPSNPGGALTVQGNLVFSTAGAYLVELNNNLSDRVHVTGSATLSGSVIVALLGPDVSKQYTILNATGGITGTFAGVNNLPIPLQGSVSYTANNVMLNFTLNYNALGSLNGNQQIVANVLSNFFNANGSIPVSFATLTQAGLSQVAGEAATGSQQTTFQAMTQFITSLLDPIIGGRETTAVPAGATNYAADDTGASAYAASGKALSQNKTLSQDERAAYAAVFTKAPLRQVYDPHWSVWASGFGGSQTTDGNAATGSNSATSRIFGMAAGADYLLSPRTLAGFALAGGGTNFSVANSGSGRSDLFQAGAFIRHNAGPAYVSAALAYGWQDVTTDRMVMANKLHAEFDANALSGRVEGGYRFATKWMGITPYAAGQVTSFFLPAYAEQVVFGANNFALGYGAQTITDTRSEIGFRTDCSFALATGLLTLRSRFAWAHDFNPDRAIAATFQALPGTSFVVNGAAQASESALTTASAEMKWRNGWSAAATFEGEFSKVTASYAGKGVVRYAW
jgi:autotransporter-associated beta strand protein